MSPGPRRIVCLTAETTETLYLLGEEDRIVGISGFTVRPPRARREKPKISGFTSAKIERIVELKPDLVLGFSNLQADIAAELVRTGLQVHIFNQRGVEEILESIGMLGRMVGAQAHAQALIDKLRGGLEAARRAALALPCRPHVYFQEWDDPLISGTRWTAELIGIAGGEDCFQELSVRPGAKDRVIADPLEVVRRAPDVLIASWCGKKFNARSVLERPGWQGIPAVRHGRLFEIKSCDILQPGPAALSDGLDQLREIITHSAQEMALAGAAATEVESTGLADSSGRRESP
ncbi:MAG: ABC transporter substrate-binding protein [Steroidobacteraceae bacterium]